MQKYVSFLIIKKQLTSNLSANCKHKSSSETALVTWGNFLLLLQIKTLRGNSGFAHEILSDNFNLAICYFHKLFVFNFRAAMCRRLKDFRL